MSTILGVTFPLPSLILNRSFLYKFARFINKSFLGSFFSIAISRYSSSISVYSSSDDLSLYSTDTLPKSFLNIGSGFFSHPLWQCLDLPACSSIYQSVQGREGVDFIPVNLNTDSLDFLPKNSYKAIYSSHTLEHLDRERIPVLFFQIYNLLLSQGTFRICIPDLLSFYNINLSHQELKFNDMLFFIREAYTPLYFFINSQSHHDKIHHLRFLHDSLSQYSFHDFLDYLPQYLYISGITNQTHPPDFHMSYPTESFLLEVALKCGFSKAYRTVRGCSHSSCFSNKFLFDTTIPDYSLYMEFVK